MRIIIYILLIFRKISRATQKSQVVFISANDYWLLFNEMHSNNQFPFSVDNEVTRSLYDQVRTHMNQVFNSRMWKTTDIYSDWRPKCKKCKLTNATRKPLPKYREDRMHLIDLVGSETEQEAAWYNIL